MASKMKALRRERDLYLDECIGRDDSRCGQAHVLQLPYELQENILSRLDKYADRASVSLSCRSWLKLEGWVRRRVKLRHCYAILPERVIERFPRMTALTIGGERFTASLCDDSPEYDDWHFFTLSGSKRGQQWIHMLAQSFPHLEELCLWHLELSDEDLKTLGDACGQSLRVVRLLSCLGFGPGGLAYIISKCRALEMFHIDRSALVQDRTTDESMLQAQLTNALVRHRATLQDLGLRPDVNCSLPVSWPQLCQGLTNLTSLEAREPLKEATGQLPASLVRLKMERGCERLKSLPNLQSLGGCLLDLANNREALEGLRSVACSLVTLNLIGTALYGEELTGLLQACKAGYGLRGLCLPNLRRLGVTLHELQALARHCGALTRLIVPDFEGNGSRALRTIAVGCPKLELLSFRYSKMGDVGGLLAVGESLTALTTLQIGLEPGSPPSEWDKGLCLDSGLEGIWRGCKLLESVDLNLPDRSMSDAGMKSLALNCKALRSLKLGGCGESDAGLYCVSRISTGLRHLMLSNCAVTESGLLQVAEGCPSLECFSVFQEGWSKDSAKRLAKKFVSLRPFWAVEVVSDLDIPSFMAFISLVDPTPDTYERYRTIYYNSGNGRVCSDYNFGQGQASEKRAA